MPRIAVLSAVILAIVCMPAWAGIGGIGSPVAPGNAPVTDKEGGAAQKPESAVEPQAAPAEEKPLLIIRFNQKRVYFERALSQAVRSAEKAKSGVVYDVVSRVPYKSSNKSEDERMVEEAQNNLQSVVGNMLQLGVPASRINTSMAPDPSAPSQEIHIFVK